MSQWNSHLTARNFAELVLQTGGSPDRPLFDCDDGRRFSFQQFWSLAGRLARVLEVQGARRGDRVAVQVEKSVEALALFWACVRGGFVFLPLNTAYTAAEVSYFIEDATPSVLVVSPQAQNSLKHLPAKLLTLDDQGGGSLVAEADAVGEIENADCGWDDLAAILYTSGTTGRSKGAMLSHGNLASNALALIECWEITAADVLIHALPVYHTHGLFVATNTLLLAGGRLIFQRKFDAERVMHALLEASMLMGVPTFYTRLLQHPGLTRGATAHVRLFVSGSAPLLAETHKEFSARTGHAILERYGMTETSMNTSNPLLGERRAGTVGMALPHVEVRVVDPQTHQSLPHESDGMIEVRGPNLFKGYWNNPAKTAEDMTRDGWFVTGDLGRYSSDGYLTISGRAKDLVITGGFNVYPKEIEERLDALPQILESAVFGVSHPDFGEAVTAVVTLKAGAAMDEAEAIKNLRQSLAAFKVPKRIVVVPELPRNAMGKVQKAVLRQTYATLYRPV
jgi:malonyl-CoA/methylmalonyl-CoA synthetase